MRISCTIIDFNRIIRITFMDLLIIVQVVDLISFMMCVIKVYIPLCLFISIMSLKNYHR